MLSYVLLIAIAMGLAIGIYAWLKAYADGGSLRECEQGTSLIVKNYICNYTGAKIIKLDMENKGMFSVSGFYIKSNNKSIESPIFPMKSIEANINPYDGIYYFKNNTITFDPIKPNEVKTALFRYDNLGDISKIRIEPFILGKKNKTILCKEAVVSYDVRGCFGEVISGTGCTDASSCDDDNACTTDDCVDGACVNTEITSCTPGDNCCPTGCASGTDVDCSASGTCGNSVLEGTETCDWGPNAAQLSCTAGQPCGPSPVDTGCPLSDQQCVNCQCELCTECNYPICGNGFLETGELCDTKRTSPCVEPYTSYYFDDYNGIEICLGNYACRNDCLGCIDQNTCTTPP